MTTVDKLTRLTQQLIGDISRLPGVTLDAAGEAQLAQLLTDAFETVGHIALDGWQTSDRFADGPPIAHHRIPTELELGIAGLQARHGKACGCGLGQSCHTCLPLPGGITF